MSSPERKRSRSPARSRSPPARRSRSPVRSRSPAARRSPSPAVRSRSPRRSRSPVRSRSPPARRYSSSRSRSPPRSRGECDTLELTRDDAAFVVGRGGSCKFKIARASGAQLDFRERDLVVEIRGTATARRRAKKYIQLVMAQRVGPVYVDEAENDDDDLTMVEVPTDCIGYVTGKKGATMRKVEEEWGTLMFFVEGKNRDGKWSSGDSGKLAIFGERRGRRGTELKVMSAVEQKIPGHFTANVKDHVDDAEWGTDTIPIGEGDLSYALGKGGVTRKKLARASHCIMEYVGNVAFMSGSKDERQRARDYLGWLMAQRVGPVHVSRAEDRDDVLITKVPAECVAYVTGQGGRSLRSIEEQTGTFCFIDGERRGVDERLLIFGGLNADRRRAKSMVDDMVDLKLSRDRMHGPYRPRSRSRSPRRSRGGRSRSRSRSPRKSSSRKSRSHSRSASPKKRSPSPAVAEKKKASKSKSKSPSPVRAKRSRSKSKSKSKSRSPSPPAKQQKVEQKDSDEKKPETKQEPKSRSPSPSPKKGSQSPAH